MEKYKKASEEDYKKFKDLNRNELLDVVSNYSTYMLGIAAKNDKTVINRYALSSISNYKNTDIKPLSIIDYYLEEYQKVKAIAIYNKDFLKYGCPECNCGTHIGSGFSGQGMYPGNCRHCGRSFIQLADSVDEIRMTTGYFNIKASIIDHPKKDGKIWKWEPKDETPKEDGEYFKSRGNGYDLAGFVRTKAAGERLVELIKNVLDDNDPKSWLDYRELEPEWIQVKIQPLEFDVIKLDKLICKEKDRSKQMITRKMLEKCKLL